MSAVASRTWKTSWNVGVNTGIHLSLTWVWNVFSSKRATSHFIFRAFVLHITWENTSRASLRKFLCARMQPGKWIKQLICETQVLYGRQEVASGLAGVIALCSLSRQVYKQVVTNLMLGGSPAMEHSIPLAETLKVASCHQPFPLRKKSPTKNTERWH